MRQLLRAGATVFAVIGFAAVAVSAALVLAGSGAARAADPGPPESQPAEIPYTLHQTALTGPKEADITLKIVGAPGAKPIAVLEDVQLTTFAADGSVERARSLTDVPAPGGVANVTLEPVPRGRRIQSEVVVRPDAGSPTYELQAATTALLRPDLAIADFDGPAQTLTSRSIDVSAEIRELDGDTAATATVTLASESTSLATATVDVPAGGKVVVVFEDVDLTSPVPTRLSASLGDVSPAQTDVSNDSASLVVDVTEHELVESNVLVPALGGYGAQFNQHVYAALTPTPPNSLVDMEAKVKALEPKLVRIFYNYAAETQFPDRMASFIETVGLADETGAAINITFQSAAGAKNNPPLFMSRFADVLDDLVRDHGFTNVRWVTIQNEPNGDNVDLTREQYEALYRELHSQLIARGLRSQIGLMAGDLVEGAGADGQRAWFGYMADHMSDIVDAYSVHIYWNYWDIPRMEYRLRDVHQIVTQELPEHARKPTFITEFGVRGLRNLPGKPEAPGYWPDGTQIARTNIAAFQQLWFNLVSAQLGFAGTAKWDAYWGKYDAGTQSHWLIGPAAEGWPLFPAYHAMQLLFQTTALGWQVLRVEPWADDDWDRTLDDQPEKEIAAYAGADGDLTLMGLDTHARALNAASTETIGYSIGGLPPSTTFNLAIWNPSADGANAIGDSLTTTPAGVARFELPLHAAFALTTVPVAYDDTWTRPVASDSAATVDEDASAEIPLVASDADGDAIEYELLAQPQHGTLAGEGAARTYTPAPDFAGDDSFTFRVSDGSLRSRVATVSITVLPVNDPPVLEVAPAGPVDESASTVVTAQVTDVDGDVVALTWATDTGTFTAGGALGTFASARAAAAATTATFTADDGPATAHVTVTGNDGHGGTALATTEIDVANVAPVPKTGAVPDAFWGLPVRLTGSATDVSRADTAAGLVATWDFGDGSSPASGFAVSHAYGDSGTYTAVLTVTDKDGGDRGTTATVAVTYTRTIARTVAGPLRITAGESVRLAPGAVVLGELTVEPGAALDVDGATIAGPLRVRGAAWLRLCGAKVAGPFEATLGTGPVLVGGDGCGPSRFNGPGTLSGNVAGVQLVGATVDGPLRVTGNRGGTTVTRNVVHGPLTVSGNALPVVDSPNTVHGPSTLQ